MAYIKTNWTDRVVQYPNRYKDQNNIQYTLSRDSGTVTSEGTPITAMAMNNIEEGVYKAVKDITDVDIHSVYKLNIDINDIYTEVQHKREDGTLAIKSVLSGGESPKYTTRTETKYLADGTTIDWVKVYTLNYDSNDNIVSEVIN